MTESMIELQGIYKSYKKGSQSIDILKNIDLSIPEGEFIALMGSSGAGKSTLLNLIAGIDSPTKGKVVVAGTEIGQMNDAQLSKWRARKVGYIFQFYNLIPVLTAYENVALPLKLTKLNKKKRHEHVVAALEIVGLGDRMDHYPNQLSGGQEQRVSIARAIAMDPKVLVADEPTGAVDQESTEEILTLFTRLSQEHKKTIVMVTHDGEAAKRANILRQLKNGELV